MKACHGERKEAAAMQVLIRLILEDRPGSLSLATAAIARIGGNILAMDVVDGEGTSCRRSSSATGR
jgi:hypothetical protein